MKLLYVYIYKYNSLENLNLNFTNEHKFLYDKEKGELIYEENKCDLNDFYCDKSEKRTVDIYAIAGDNGVGKSSILSFIINEICCIYSGIHNTLFAFLDDEEKIRVFYKYYVNPNKECIYIKFNKKNKSYFEFSDKSIKEKTEKYFIIKLDNTYNISHQKKRYESDLISYFYNTSFILYNNYYGEGISNFEDISTSKLFRAGNYDNVKNSIQFLNEFFSRDFLTQIKFVYEYQKYSEKKYISFKLPNKVWLEPRNLHKEIKDLKKYCIKESDERIEKIIKVCLELNDKIQDISGMLTMKR